MKKTIKHSTNETIFNYVHYTNKGIALEEERAICLYWPKPAELIPAMLLAEATIKNDTPNSWASELLQPKDRIPAEIYGDLTSLCDHCAAVIEKSIAREVKLGTLIAKKPWEEGTKENTKIRFYRMLYAIGDFFAMLFGVPPTPPLKEILVEVKGDTLAEKMNNAQTHEFTLPDTATVDSVLEPAIQEEKATATRVARDAKKKRKQDKARKQAKTKREKREGEPGAGTATVETVDEASHLLREGAYQVHSMWNRGHRSIDFLRTFTQLVSKN